MKPGRFVSRPGNSKINIFYINTSFRDEKRPALINFPLHIIIKGSANQSCLEKDSLKVYEHIKKYLYINSQQQLPVRFCEYLPSDKTMYSEHCLQLKRSWFQEQFCVATSLIRNLCSKTLILLISQRSNIYEKK